MTGSLGIPTEHPDAAGVRAAVEEFITAFDRLEWDRFARCFAADPVVFFPEERRVLRADGPEVVQAAFKRLFDEVRARSAGPNYLGLVPRDVTTRVWGDVALVTFHLVLPEGIGRRTLLFHRSAAREWRIVHLHASNAGGPNEALASEPSETE